MGKLTISMAIFNSYVKLPEGTVVDVFQQKRIFELSLTRLTRQQKVEKDQHISHRIHGAGIFTY